MRNIIVGTLALVFLGFGIWTASLIRQSVTPKPKEVWVAIYIDPFNSSSLDTVTVVQVKDRSIQFTDLNNDTFSISLRSFHTAYDKP